MLKLSRLRIVHTDCSDIGTNSKRHIQSRKGMTLAAVDLQDKWDLAHLLQ